MDKSIFNRKMYKTVKKMDRQEMEEFIKDIYRSGFKDGSEVGDKADFMIKLAQVLNNTKGVGITLYDRIMEKAKEMDK